MKRPCLNVIWNWFLEIFSVWTCVLHFHHEIQHKDTCSSRTFKVKHALTFLWALLHFLFLIFLFSSSFLFLPSCPFSLLFLLFFSIYWTVTMCEGLTQEPEECKELSISFLHLSGCEVKEAFTTGHLEERILRAKGGSTLRCLLIFVPDACYMLHVASDPLSFPASGAFCHSCQPQLSLWLAVLSELPPVTQARALPSCPRLLLVVLRCSRLWRPLEKRHILHKW